MPVVNSQQGREATSSLVGEFGSSPPLLGPGEDCSPSAHHDDVLMRNLVSEVPMSNARILDPQKL